MRLHVLESREQLDQWLPAIDALTITEARRAGSLLLVQDAAFYRRYCEDQGRTIVAELDGELAGVTLLAFGDAIHPAYDEDLERLGVGRSEVAVGLQSLVNPALRGRGLGRALLLARAAVARARGLRYVLSTTAPENATMLALKASLGARELSRRRVYSTQVLRVILVEDLGVSRAPTLSDFG